VDAGIDGDLDGSGKWPWKEAADCRGDRLLARNGNAVSRASSEQGEQTDMTTSWGLTLKPGARQFGSWHNKDALWEQSPLL